MRGRTGETYFLPIEGGGGLYVARHQARCFGIVEVGDHQHRGRMFDEAIGHFFEAQTHVLEADLLGHRQQRHCRMQGMHLTHQPRQDGGIAHAGIKDAQRRR